MKVNLLSLLTLSFIAGCVTTQAEEPVKRMAAFDLDCTKDKIKLSVLNEDSVSGIINYGASGCGKKAAYICQRKIIGGADCVKDSETSRK